MNFNLRPVGAVLLSCLLLGRLAAAEPARSHPPLRPYPQASKRPAAAGPAYYVDAAKGNDAQNGSQEKPWKSIRYAVEQLGPGDTLYLRGGVYYENVVLRGAGRLNAPITIRSFPGELATLDGGIRAFFETPAECWEPHDKGAAGEYRSTKRYANLRNVVGAFGDSLVGLQSYYHAKDLRAASEVVEQESEKGDIKPLYCGPGVWYDRETGYLHCRLAHTHLAGFANYRGETDPRKLPLIIAPFRSVPLALDGAQHVRLQDLVVRGGGYDTITLDQSRDIEIDNVVVWCGTYGVRATGVQKLKFTNSALHGNVAPWSSRFEAGLRTYPGRPTRDLTRMNTHALWVSDANREFSVYAFPFNDDWEIAHCDFTDAHDGLYLGGVDVKFHHNTVRGLHDDGLYLSQMYDRHHYLRGGAEIHIFQNYFAGCLTTFAYGGAEDTQDKIYLYRNIVDLRERVPTARPVGKEPPALFAGQVMGDHGSPPWPALFAYHNTVVVRTPARAAEMNLVGAATKERPRRVFNNLLVHLERLPKLTVVEADRAWIDGNLYWQPALDEKTASGFFESFRKSTPFEQSKLVYALGFHARSRVADPKFVKLEIDGAAANDYRLQSDSPAINAGAEIPKEWPDPLRGSDQGAPDIGALPIGSEPLRPGRLGQ